MKAIFHDMTDILPFKCLVTLDQVYSTYIHRSDQNFWTPISKNWSFGEFVDYIRTLYVVY